MTDETKAASEPKTVPYDRFKQVNDEKNLSKAAETQARAEATQTREENLRLQKELSAKTTVAPARVTHESVQKEVDDGRLTKEQGQDLLDKQFREDTAESARVAAREAVTQVNFEERQELGFRKYKTAHPDLAAPGSEKMQKVTTEYNRLVANGSPPTKATELIALELTLGPAETIKQVETPTFQGGGVSYEEEADQGGIPADVAKMMTPREKSFYAPQVKDGDYTWKEVGEELKHSNRTVAQRANMIHGKV